MLWLVKLVRSSSIRLCLRITGRNSSQICSTVSRRLRSMRFNSRLPVSALDKSRWVSIVIAIVLAASLILSSAALACSASVGVSVARSDSICTRRLVSGVRSCLIVVTSWELLLVVLCCNCALAVPAVIARLSARRSWCLTPLINKYMDTAERRGCYNPHHVPGEVGEKITSRTSANCAVDTQAAWD